MKFEYQSGLFVALVALAQVTGGTAQADPVLNRVELRGAIAAHLTHDWELKALASEVEASEATVWRSYAVFLPKVDFSAKYDHFRKSGVRGISRSAKIDLSMPLFTSGRNVNLMLGAQNNALAQKYNYLSAEKRSAFAGVRIYMDLYASRAKARAYSQNVSRLQKVLSGVLAREEAGLADFGDVSQARAVLLQAKQQLILARATVQQREIDFRSETGQPASAGIPLPDVAAFIPASLALALESGRRTHPDVLSARYQAVAATRLADATLGTYLPQLNLTGAYERAFDEDNAQADDEWRVGLSLTMKLFDGESVPAVIEAQKQAQASGYRALDSGRKIDHEIRSAWHAYHSTLKNRRVALKRIEALISAADVAAKKHEAGLVPVADQLRAEIALSNARIELFQLQTKTVLSGFRLGFSANLVPVSSILVGNIK